MNAEGYLFLVHRGTEKVIDMDPNGVNDVHQWGFNGGAWQQWYPELMGIVPGNFRVLPRHAQGSVMDVAGVNPNDGALVNLWNWLGGANQQWQLSDVGSGRFRFSPLHSLSKALDVIGAPANGTTVGIWGAHGGANQRWSFSRVDGNWVRLTPDNGTAYCLEVGGGSGATANGSRIQLWSWLNGQNQHWSFVDPDL